MKFTLFGAIIYNISKEKQKGDKAWLLHACLYMKKRYGILSPVLLLLSFFGIVYCCLMLFLLSSTSPVDVKDEEVQEVVIDSYGLRGISKELQEEGYVKSGLAFFLRAQLSGTAGKIDSGTFYLSKNMDVDKIISVMSRGGHDRTQTLTLRIPEGATIEEIADLLLENEVCYDKEAFLELCKTGGNFLGDASFPYLEEREDGAKYVFEGYLFPDTYDFYYNSRPEEVVYKLLARFNEVYTADIKAQELPLGYTTEDVIKIASIIQKEGNESDFNKVSAVIRNRLTRDMYLQCDSTIRYVLNDINTISLDKEQYEYDSKYNSYENRGLTPSPICSPSLAAIQAALNPDKDFLEQEYLYFCSKDSGDKDLIFAKTYQEHLENVKKYKENWKAYDDTVRAN